MNFQNVLRSKIIALMLGLFVYSLPVEALTLPTLDTTMTTPIFNTFAAGFAFRPVEPASSLGRIFGVYAGLGVSAVDQGSNSTIISGIGTFLPSADLQFGISIPMGLT